MKTREHGLHLHFYDEIVKSNGVEKKNPEKPYLIFDGISHPVNLFKATLHKDQPTSFMMWAWALEDLFVQVLDVVEVGSKRKLLNLHVVFGMESLEEGETHTQWDKKYKWHHCRCSVVGEVQYDEDKNPMYEHLGPDLRFFDVPFNIAERRMWVLYNKAFPRPNPCEPNVHPTDSAKSKTLLTSSWTPPTQPHES